MAILHCLILILLQGMCVLLCHFIILYNTSYHLSCHIMLWSRYRLFHLSKVSLKFKKKNFKTGENFLSQGPQMATFPEKNCSRGACLRMRTRLLKSWHWFFWLAENPPKVSSLYSPTGLISYILCGSDSKGRTGLEEGEIWVGQNNRRSIYGGGHMEAGAWKASERCREETEKFG